MNSFSHLARALWELKHVQYSADIVRWAGFTKYVIYRKRGAFDSAHAYTLIGVKGLITTTKWLAASKNAREFILPSFENGLSLDSGNFSGLSTTSSASFA